MVGGATASNSRAALLRYLRSAAYDADPAAHVGVRFAGDPTSWPPSLQIDLGPATNPESDLPTASQAICKLTCAPSLIKKIAPALKWAVEAGWLSGIECSPMVCEARPAGTFALHNLNPMGDMPEAEILASHLTSLTDTSMQSDDPMP